MRERTNARSLARHAIQLRPPTAGCSIVNQAGLRTCEGGGARGSNACKIGLPMLYSRAQWISIYTHVPLRGQCRT